MGEENIYFFCLLTNYMGTVAQNNIRGVQVNGKKLSDTEKSILIEY